MPSSSFFKMDSQLSRIRAELETHSQQILQIVSLLDRLIDRLTTMHDGSPTPPPLPKDHEDKTIPGFWISQGRKNKTFVFVPFTRSDASLSSQSPSHLEHFVEKEG